MDKENRLVRIYELRDPRDIECKPRYVGITTSPLQRRLYQHIYRIKDKTHTYKNCWIKKLLKENISPTIHLIEEVTGWDYACNIEQYWIKEFRKQGYKLTNSTDGGSGPNNQKLSEETKRKISIGNKGKVRTEEFKKAISLRNKGIKWSEESKLKFSNYKKRPIIIEFPTKIKIEYSSAIDAALVTEPSLSSILKMLKGQIVMKFINYKITYKYEK